MDYNEFVRNTEYYNFSFNLFNKNRWCTEQSTKPVVVDYFRRAVEDDMTVFDVAFQNGPAYMDRLQSVMKQRIDTQSKPVPDYRQNYMTATAVSFFGKLNEKDPELGAFLIALNQVDWSDPTDQARLDLSGKAALRKGLYLAFYEMFKKRYEKGQHDVFESSGTSAKTDNQHHQ